MSNSNPLLAASPPAARARRGPRRSRNTRPSARRRSPSSAMRTRSAAGDAREVLRVDRQEHHALVQHLVVLQVVQQRVRHAVGRRGQEHRRARDARRRARLDALDEEAERHRVLGEPLHQQRAAALPRREQREHDAADQQREPAAVRHLERVRREERRGRSGTAAPRSRTATSRLQPQMRRMTTKISTESISIASVTAMP